MQLPQKNGASAIKSIMAYTVFILGKNGMSVFTLLIRCGT